MAIVDIVLPVFLVIGLGYVLRVVRFVTDEVNAALSKLVFYVAAPALLFRSTTLTPLGRSLNLHALLVIAGATLLVALLVYVATARCVASRRGVLTQGAHRSNMVFMGLPVVAYAYGESVLGPVAVQVGFMVVFYNFLAVLVLLLPHQQTSARDAAVWGRTARSVARNPLIIGCGAGICCSALGVGLPVSLDRALDLVGRTALPLALVSVGAGIDFGTLRADIHAASVIAGIKLIGYPALIYLGLLACGQSGVDVEVFVLVMASPTAVVSYIMAREMRGDEQLAGAIVIGSTVASLVTMSGWLVFFRFG